MLCIWRTTTFSAQVDEQATYITPSRAKMSALTSSAAALAALEPYLLLAKNAKGAAAAKLIEQATSAPGCYVFSELLDVDGIKQVRDSPKRETLLQTRSMRR